MAKRRKNNDLDKLVIEKMTKAATRGFKMDVAAQRAATYASYYDTSAEMRRNISKARAARDRAFQEVQDISYEVAHVRGPKLVTKPEDKKKKRK